MRIVLWIANEPHQKALANKLHAQFPLSGIITETRHHKPVITIRKIFDKIVEKIFLSSIAKAWWGMTAYYEKKYPAFPDVPRLDVENINSEAAFAFTQQLQPDLILVSGTRLVRKKMLGIQPSIGILNLHTGLSPYIKGGPNCTNWCVATEQFHLIGNTIMWIDAGIDTGNILATEFTPLTGKENLDSLHLAVMEHAHHLYVRAVNYLAAGKRTNVPQSGIAEGTTYYSKQWGLKEKFRLVKNIKKLPLYFQPGRMEEMRKGVEVVGIDYGP